MTRNSYSIILYQGGPPHELYFVAIDNHGRAIIRPNKKSVAMYVVGELEVLVWIHGDMNAENRVLL